MEGLKIKAVDINNLDAKTEVKEEKPQETPNEEVQQEQTQTEEQQGNEQGNELQGQEEVTLKDEDVLGFLKNKGIEVNSFEDLTKPKETEIPEDIKSFLDYKKETGRDFKDFLELQKDWKSEKDDTVLKRYLKDKNPYFTDEDIKDELSEFNFDEDIDDESEVRKKKREKRKLLSEALSHLESQKEQYKMPTERFSEKANAEIPEEYKSAKTKLSEIIKSQEEQSVLIKENQQKFLDQTKSILNQEFKGFEFDINGDKKIFKSGDAENIFKQQSDINNFVSKFTDENGVLKDVKGYHKALNTAMNADAIAKHFYELGKSEAIKEEAIESKNINLSGHKSMSKKPLNSGLKIKAYNPTDNRVKVRY